MYAHLGMTFDFSLKLGAAIIQWYFFKKLRSDLPEGLKVGHRKNPAPYFLFKVDRNSVLLNQERREQCYKTTAKCLWLGQRSWPDMKLASGLHCTRAKVSSVHDWDKMLHLLGHIWCTRCIPLIISIDDEGNAHSYVDRSHATHSNGRGHSSSFVTMGKGAMMNS